MTTAKTRGKKKLTFITQPPAKSRPDYVEHGSERHASLLGLRQAVEGEKYQHEGWALEDITQFGINVQEEYIQAVLILCLTIHLV